MSLFKNTCYQDVQSTDLLLSQIYKIKLHLFFKFEKDWEVKENIFKSHNSRKDLEIYLAYADSAELSFSKRQLCPLIKSVESWGKVGRLVHHNHFPKNPHGTAYINWLDHDAIGASMVKALSFT